MQMFGDVAAKDGAHKMPILGEESNGRGWCEQVLARVCGWRRMRQAMAALALIGCMTAMVPRMSAQVWKLEWSDEFDGPAGSAPNAQNWTYDTGGGGWGNKELEIYCAPGSSAAPCDAADPNVFLDGKGDLVIRAVNRGGTWTSGRLKTEGKKTFEYGRVEARMKLAAAPGFWPAFWMLGSQLKAQGWPLAGEQDIMEWVQSYGPQTTSSTVHGPGYSGGHGIGSRFTFPGDGRIDDGFHTYGVVWTKDRLQFYRDNPAQPYFTVTPANLPPGTQWVYNQPFFLLLNFAIGSGGFAGTTDASTPSTGTVLVDYVRVYRGSASIDEAKWYSVRPKQDLNCAEVCGTAAEWQFKAVGGGFYRVQMRGVSGDAAGVGGKLVRVSEERSAEATEWRLDQQADGSYRLVNRGSGGCLARSAGALKQMPCDTEDAQRFVLTEQP